MVTIEWPCPNHPDKEAEAWCVQCGRKFCNDCLTEDNEKYYCQKCMDENQAERMGENQSETSKCPHGGSDEIVNRTEEMTR